MSKNCIQKKLRSAIKIEKEPPYCWEWLLGFNGAGYPQFRLDGKYYLAHRESYLQRYKYIPQGMVVHHRCGNKRCINPGHLIPLTHKENIRRSRYKLGRKGESNGNSKLSESAVETIFEMTEVGLRQKDSALIFNIHESTVSNILSGRSWPHVHARYNRMKTGEKPEISRTS